MTTKKEHVRKEGGKFNIFKGDLTFTEENGVVVNLVMTPRVGTINVGMTSGIHEPGMGFTPHVHPLSEETLLVFKGKGEMFLKDRWIPVEEGDVIYAPPGVLHGTRNPEGNTEPFYTIGIGTPPQADLYQKTHYDVLSPVPMDEEEL